MPWRVLHVVPTLGRRPVIGGAERIVTDLVRYQQRGTAIQPRLCVIGPENPHYAAFGLAERPVFLDLPAPGFSRAALFRGTLALRSVIRDFRPDIVHSHLWLADFLTALALLGRNERHVVHLQDTRTWVLDPRRRLRRLATRWLLKSSRAHFIAVAEAVRQFFANNLPAPPDRIRVIYNALDESWFARSREVPRHQRERVIIGMAGRLQPEKGCSYLIEAAARLAERGIAFELRVAGGGAQLAALQDKAQRLGIGPRVQFLGRVADMHHFYEDLDIFVLPSVSSEGFPVSILEAMAMGKAVVATNVAGIPEEIQHEQDGLLVPPADAPALAEALERLARDPALREQLGSRAVERARLFSLTRMATAVEQYYQEILAAPRKPWPRPSRTS